MKKYIFTETQIKNIIGKTINENTKGVRKILFTESQVKKVLKKLISEQSDEINKKKAIQCFLNKRFKINLDVDGRHGEETSKAISKFQSLKTVYPVDGVWGSDTEKKLNKKERVVFDECVNEFSDFIDKGLRFLNLKS